MGFDLDDGSDLEEYEHMEPGLLTRLLGREPKSLNLTSLEIR